jgi:hypothetical protein
VADRTSEPTHTPDGHHLVVDGRRWQATDPAIPPALAAELRSALMTARRDVAAARRTSDDPAERDARTRVHAAKVALGERGRPWWEPPDPDADRARIAAAIVTLVASRRPGTTCPSDVARAVGGTRWRSLMAVTREVTASLVARGEVVATQHGERAEPPWRGPIRIGAVAEDRIG